MNRPCRLAIFDLDGTLLDSLEDLANSANEMLAAEGFPSHEVARYRTFVGDGARNLVERILPPESRNPEVIDRCLARYAETYARRWDERSQPYEGMAELLDALEARGIALAVLSNKPHAATERCMARFFGKWTWTVILGQQEGRPRKPDPAGVFEILRRTGITPGETVYLGDTDTDMRTAVGAGVFAVGVLWGFREREELETHGAEVVIERPGQLLSTLEHA